MFIAVLFSGEIDWKTSKTSLFKGKSKKLVCLKVFRPRTPSEAIDLVSRLLEYTPTSRLSPLQACAHAFFDELRQPGCRLPNGRELPPLFNFTEQGRMMIFCCNYFAFFSLFR